MRCKCRLRPEVAPDEGVAHVAPDFESRRTYARAEIGDQISRLDRHPVNRVFDHARCETAPAGVGDGHGSAGTVGQKHGNAVGYQHTANGSRATCDTRVGFRGVRQRVGLDWLCASRQVHGTDVQLLRTRSARGGEPVAIDADGHATALRGVGAMVLTADCLPVALAGAGTGEGAGAVAMVHAGWRGLAGGVLEQGVRALRELGAGGELEAAIGPGAGVCCYEVGADVHRAFGGAGRDGDAIDLRTIARERLHAAGVASVRDVRACTICDERFFSHRRDGECAGRQAGVAWLS